MTARYASTISSLERRKRRRKSMDSSMRNLPRHHIPGSSRTDHASIPPSRPRENSRSGCSNSRPMEQIHTTRNRLQAMAPTPRRDAKNRQLEDMESDTVRVI